MRTIHYSIRLVIIFILVSALYLATSLLFHQAIQQPILIMLLFIAISTERLGVLLDWIGPVVGTPNRQKQEQELKHVVEYQLTCALRYDSPLVIAAICSKKRISSHVLSHLMRMSDIVQRATEDYIFVLMPFTNLSQAPFAFKRLIKQLPINEIVVTDISMLRDLVKSRRLDSSDETTARITPEEMRKAYFLEIESKVANLKMSRNKNDPPALYYLFDRRGRLARSQLTFDTNKPEKVQDLADIVNSSNVTEEITSEVTN